MTTKTPLPDLTVAEACKELNISHMHVYRMLHAGQLEGYKIGKVTRIHRASLDALKKNNPWKPVAKRGPHDTREFWARRTPTLDKAHA